jgi:predicted secreted protein
MRRAAVAVLAAAALLAGCDDGDDSGLVFKDPKGTIEVEERMTFSLEFSVNASVGNDWEPVAMPKGAAAVKLKDTKVDYPNPDADGDSGTKRFVYEATTSGTQGLTFRKLFRGDEKERRTITLVIRG